MSVDPRVQKWCAWTGPAFVALMLGGMLLAHMIPWTWEPAPAASANTIAHFYETHRTEIRVGSLLCVLSQALYIPFGALIAWHTKTIERGFPIISGMQVAVASACAAIGTPFGVFWALAAFRAGDPGVSDQVIRAFNDAGWIFFMIPLPVFTLWFFLIAVLLCSRRNDESVFPRWVGYLNWLAVFGILPVYFVIFFKHGALGWNGSVALYIPLLEFCAWFIVMSVVLLRAAGRAQPLELTPTERERELGAPYIPTVSAT